MYAPATDIITLFNEWTDKEKVSRLPKEIIEKIVVEIRETNRSALYEHVIEPFSPVSAYALFVRARPLFFTRNKCDTLYRGIQCYGLHNPVSFSKFVELKSEEYEYTFPYNIVADNHNDMILSFYERGTKWHSLPYYKHDHFFPEEIERRVKERSSFLRELGFTIGYC